MIQMQTRLKVTDNSGAKTIGVIKVIRQGKPDAGSLGDVVVASVQTALSRGQVKAKEVVQAVIVRQRKPLRRSDGSTIKFEDSGAAIITPDGTPRGSRIFGPVARELRDEGFMKIVSLAEEVV